MKLKVKIPRSAFNDTYFPYLDDQTPTQIYFGGSSAGKSAFIVGQRLVRDLLIGHRNYLVVRQTARTSRFSTFSEVKNVINDWGLNDIFRINKSDMTITCLQSLTDKSGAQVIFAGLDDPAKLQSIRPEKGVITDLLIEEATETNREDLGVLSKRLRGIAKVTKRIIFVFNPILRSHWIYKDYFDGNFKETDRLFKSKDLLILKTTYKDNKFLMQDDIDRLENEKDEYLYNVFTLGNWGILGDLIFKNWTVEDLSQKMETFDNIRNGLDFGFSKNPYAYNRMHYDQDRKIIYIFKERHEAGLTNDLIADDIRDIVKGEVVTCDSSEPKSVEELVRHGVNAYGAVKGPDSVRHGIQWLNQHKIIVHKDCYHTIEEFSTYQYKKDRKTGDVLDEPVKINDHHMDDIRYAMESDMLNDREIFIG